MKRADKFLDDNPNYVKCLEVVDNDVLHRLADNELLHFQDSKSFLYKHPLAAQKKFEQECLEDLAALKKKSPEKFICEMTNVTQNIRRINSQIRQKKYKDEEMLRSWEENLMKAEFRLKILAELIK